MLESCSKPWALVLSSFLGDSQVFPLCAGQPCRPHKLIQMRVSWSFSLPSQREYRDTIETNSNVASRDGNEAATSYRKISRSS